MAARHKHGLHCNQGHSVGHLGELSLQLPPHFFPANSAKNGLLKPWGLLLLLQAFLVSKWWLGMHQNVLLRSYMVITYWMWLNDETKWQNITCKTSTDSYVTRCMWDSWFCRTAQTDFCQIIWHFTVCSNNSFSKKHSTLRRLDPCLFCYLSNTHEWTASYDDLTAKPSPNMCNWPSVFIRHWFRFLCLDGVQYGSEDSPRLGKLVDTHKVDLTSTEHVQYQALIRLWHFHTLYTDTHVHKTWST